MPERAELVRALIQALPVPVVLSARDNGLILYANEPAARAFGIPVDDLIGFRAPDVYVRPRDRETILDIIKDKGRLREHEVLLKGPQGVPFWALVNSEPLAYDGQSTLCTTFVDINHRKAAEDAAQKALSFAESIIATVRDPLLVLDRHLKILSVNPAFRRTFGLTEGKTLGTRLHDLENGDWDIPRLRELLTDIAINDAEVTDFEVTPHFLGGGTRTFLLNARKLYRPGNEAETILLSMEDITERKRSHHRLISAKSAAEARAERQAQELAETERRLANILRNTPGVVYRCANDGQWTMEFISEGCWQLTGYAPHELVENRVVAYADLIHPEDRAGVWDAVQAASQERRPFQTEYRIRAKNHQEEKWVWEQGVAVHEGDQLVALEGVIHDISERKQAERERYDMELQMRAAQRMQAVGRLASGVAHDFNNLLTVITGYAGFLRNDLREAASREDVDAILSAAERAARLTGQLLAFSRRQVQELRVLSLNEVVGELDKMLRRLIGEDIELASTPSLDLGRVKVDVTQIEQVLMNLVVNARDAMPRGGKLTIETANVVLDETYGAAKGVEVPAGPYVMLAVTDTGTGMDKETQAQIFEPFFTTKEKGRGTGLGLSTVYGIVKQSGGYVWVYSEPNQGTTFKIYLPRVEEESTRQAPRHQAPEDFRGAETILLVEDEETVRQVAIRMLEGHGYQVLEASHGKAALVLCQRHPGPIHLMLTDVVMPEMNGRELAERASTMRPEMQVIFSSGYTDHAIARHAVLDAKTKFIQKPFNTEALMRKVRETLDQS